MWGNDGLTDKFREASDWQTTRASDELQETRSLLIVNGPDNLQRGKKKRG